MSLFPRVCHSMSLWSVYVVSNVLMFHACCIKCPYVLCVLYSTSLFPRVLYVSCVLNSMSLFPRVLYSMSLCSMFVVFNVLTFHVCCLQCPYVPRVLYSMSLCSMRLYLMSLCPTLVVFDVLTPDIATDFQDYVENMDRHADNKKWKQWNLESTAKILEKRFSNSFVWVVRPSRYHLNTFACYQNFVDANMFGVPDHRNNDYGALHHLRTLLESAVKQSECYDSYIHVVF